MLGLITDRTQRNTYMRSLLGSKAWADMTEDERAEWLGDIFASTETNLLPCGPYYSSVVELKYRNRKIVAKATVDGVWLYAVSIVGEASKFSGKTLTLSVGSMTVPTGATPKITAYWHDDGGFDYAGAELVTAGSVTFTPYENTNNRQYLALYIYVTTDGTVKSGAEVQFHSVMLNLGETPSPYVPYVDIRATECTKGAYNYSDLNRVERAVAEISDIVEFGFTTRTDWSMWDIPKSSDMTRYLNNIRIIKDAFLVDVELPISMDHLTYIDANNIERVLVEAANELNL